MTDSISHRGPDGEGYFSNNNIGFGHRRLAIIDLSDNANQPFISSDGLFTLIYNGEVYNFKEIKKNYLLKVIFLPRRLTRKLCCMLGKSGEKNQLRGLTVCFLLQFMIQAKKL